MEFVITHIDVGCVGDSSRIEMACTGLGVPYTSLIFLHLPLGQEKYYTVGQKFVLLPDGFGLKREQRETQIESALRITEAM